MGYETFCGQSNRHFVSNNDVNFRSRLHLCQALADHPGNPLSDRLAERPGQPESRPWGDHGPP